MSASAWSQTIADGSYEWQRAASAPQRLLAALRLVGALMRVCAFTIRVEAAKALETPFVRRWLVGTTAVSAALWIINPLFQQGHWAPHFYIVDFGEIFVTFAMPAFLLLSLTRSRASAAPRLGTIAVVIGTLMVWLFILIPLGLAQRYTVAYQGRVYVPVPWFIVVQWLVATAVFAWVVLGLADRVIVHQRRPFLMTLSMLLPLSAIALWQRELWAFTPLLNQWRVVPYVQFSIAAALGAAALWAGLTWESHADRHGAPDVIR